MGKRLIMTLIGVLLLGCLSGCQGDSEARLDPSKPVYLTVWHYYNGAQQAAFDALVSEFNATVGREQGIYVESSSQGSVSDLEVAITKSAAQAIGSQELPDIFSTYADTALALQQQGLLADLSDYFSEKELSDYVPGYVQEGYLLGDGALYLFPVAKSTEILMLNATDWEPFAQATGTQLEELDTTEGITAVAQRYYEWTDAQTPDIPDDGKAFYGRDSMSNYFLIGMKQMGVSLFDVEDGEVIIRADRDKIRRLWDNYYVPYLQGWFVNFGKFRSDDVKTGDLIAYTGSTSSAMYFPDQVVDEDSSRPISYLIRTAPIMEGGSRVYVQQGADMAVTKSNALHEYAACQFLKWFTSKENSLRFVCESAYLPVRIDSNSVASLDEVIAAQDLRISSKAYDCLKCVLDSFKEMEFYTTRCFANGYATRKVLDFSLSDKAEADKAAIDAQVAAGTSRKEATAPYLTEEAFEAWYQVFCQALEEKAHPQS